MSCLISLEKIYLSYGVQPLLDHVDLQIFRGERVCLIGRNGAGKSSLLKIIEGAISPDSGKIYRDPGLRISRLTQELPQEMDLTVYEVVSQGLAATGKLLAEYHHCLQHLSDNPDDLALIEKLQHEIDQCDGWQFEQSIQEVLTRLALPAEQKISELSGGWQRRVALAKALVVKPDLLLLDEPTNHLDVEAIQWLEEQLLKFEGGILFITHDRALLQRLATRIIELDRGHLTSWPGDYANFLRRKEEALAAEANLNKEFDKKLAEEERWIRQGVKARRTRNEGRVRALEAMRVERSQRRELQGNAKIALNEANRSGELVVDAEHISQNYDDKVLIKDFSIRIMRGDRIGLLGPNGAGKTTLLNILLGKIQPSKGTVQLGSKLEVAYFDQLRAKLDPEKSILDNLAEGRTSIKINGSERHVIGYLQDFLFLPQRMHTPVKALSGGECNRLLLAKLFSLPANILVMDEPTNDLDLETLELLEELLTQFSGTLLLVSHDRAFLDNIVTSTIVFEGDGNVKEYIGGYQDWLRQSKKTAPVLTKKASELAPIRVKDAAAPKKLSFKEQKEFAELPARIETLEQQQAELLAITSQSDFYQQSPDKIAQALDQLKQLELEIEQAYVRWEALEKHA
jgi:ATP-binding cassette subfamily F protein uup